MLALRICAGQAGPDQQLADRQRRLAGAAGIVPLRVRTAAAGPDPRETTSKLVVNFDAGSARAYFNPAALAALVPPPAKALPGPVCPRARCWGSPPHQTRAGSRAGQPRYAGPPAEASRAVVIRLPLRRTTRPIRSPAASYTKPRSRGLRVARSTTR